MRNCLKHLDYWREYTMVQFFSVQLSFILKCILTWQWCHLKISCLLYHIMVWYGSLKLNYNDNFCHSYQYLGLRHSLKASSLLYHSIIQCTILLSVITLYFGVDMTRVGELSKMSLAAVSCYGILSCSKITFYCVRDLKYCWGIV